MLETNFKPIEEYITEVFSIDECDEQELKNFKNFTDKKDLERLFFLDDHHNYYLLFYKINYSVCVVEFDPYSEFLDYIDFTERDDLISFVNSNFYLMDKLNIIDKLKLISYLKE